MALSFHASGSEPVVRLVCPPESTVPIRSLRIEVPRTGEYCLSYSLDPNEEHLDDVPDDAVRLPGVGFAWIERIGNLPI